MTKILKHVVLALETCTMHRLLAKHLPMSVYQVETVTAGATPPRPSWGRVDCTLQVALTPLWLWEGRGWGIRWRCCEDAFISLFLVSVPHRISSFDWLVLLRIIICIHLSQSQIGQPISLTLWDSCFAGVQEVAGGCTADARGSLRPKSQKLFEVEQFLLVTGWGLDTWRASGQNPRARAWLEEHTDLFWTPLGSQVEMSVNYIVKGIKSSL